LTEDVTAVDIGATLAAENTVVVGWVGVLDTEGISQMPKAD
jgi:hypothetical protein